jgi:hypothetical protein
VNAKRAVVVGVGKSGDFDELHGARSGAVQVGDWLERQGFEVQRLIDDGRSVCAQEVADAIARADPTTTERLFVYFAGHGLSKGIGRDLWLMSDGPLNSVAHINVDYSLSLAALSGIEHVAVFADACRSPFVGDYAGVEGMPVFPNRARPGQVELDKIFATQPGTVAYEISPAQDPLAAYGVFTHALLEALSGKVPDAIEAVGDRLAVTAQAVGRWIKAEVARRSSRIANAVTQDPAPFLMSTGDRRVLTWVPCPPEAKLTVKVIPRKPSSTVKVLVRDKASPGTWPIRYDGRPPAVITLPCPSSYEVVVTQPQRTQPTTTIGPRALLRDEELPVRTIAADRGESAPPGSPSPSPAPSLLRVKVAVVDDEGVAHATAPDHDAFQVVTTDVVTGTSVAELRILHAGERPAPADIELDEAANAMVARCVDAAVRGHFETATGFSVDGDAVEEVALAGQPPVTPGGDLFEERNAWHIRADRAGTVMARITGDRWVAGAMLPGFLGAAVVEKTSGGEEGTVGLTYRAAPGGPWHVQDDAELVMAEAIANAAAQHGRFGVLGDPHETAAYLRRFKHVEPVLGILAAYAYDSVGQRDRIRDMVRWFVDAGQVVPFDVWLLARLPGRPDTGLAPGFPLLARGWSFLDSSNAHPAVLQARQALTPAPWATVFGQAGSVLAEAVRNSQV